MGKGRRQPQQSAQGADVQNRVQIGERAQIAGNRPTDWSPQGKGGGGGVRGHPCEGFGIKTLPLVEF